MMPFSKNDWGVNLGGSSGFGLATAHEVSAHGMSLCIVHRDRWGATARIEPEFHKIRERGTALLVFDADVLDREGRASIVTELSEVIGSQGRVGVLFTRSRSGIRKVTRALCNELRACRPRNRARHGGTLAVAGIDQAFHSGREYLDAFASSVNCPAPSVVNEEEWMRKI